MLQSAIFNCLAKALEPRAVTRLLNLMIQEYPWMDGYITQYLDELNVEILEMDQDKRLKFLTVLAKRLTELDAPDSRPAGARKSGTHQVVRWRRTAA